MMSWYIMGPRDSNEMNAVVHHCSHRKTISVQTMMYDDVLKEFLKKASSGKLLMFLAFKTQAFFFW
jgi:hypothetical protein